MKRFIGAVGVAFALTAAGLASTVPAHAQGVELQIGPDGVRPVVRDRDRDRRPMGCSEREARAAARESGLRDPEVVRVTPSRVVVEGRTRRGPDRITFANERGCPEL
ncbi:MULTISPECIES: hypothetical protein [unclassified Rhizobium]|uniref:hypothetical protein n=1 Tax=unclassified Rhizobium TaxID=2613769 RepID=UPI003D2E76A2